MSPKVLLVDDDERLRSLIASFLGKHAIEAEAVGTAAAAQRYMQRDHYDLVVLDLMLPDGDGISLCRRLRELSPGTPIIMLSARGDDVDRIIGLEVGADDYLAKPCNPRELVARIHSVLRRTRQRGLPAVAASRETLRFGDFELDLWRRVLSRGGEAVRLTTGEYQLLEALALNSRRVLGRDELHRMVSGNRGETLSRSIDLLVSRLRRVLEPDADEPRYIQTVWGRGYIFVPDHGAAEATP
ncbi:MAG TPA: response regulator [Solimonas sp.]|nr:response regulator [Solimonas sp.]